MIFNSRIDIYQQSRTFEHGESETVHVLVQDTPLYCHLKFTGGEQVSANRKKAIRRAKVTYEVSPVVLTARDVLKVDDDYFRLLHPPTKRKGLSNRTFYEVDVIETFDVEVA